VDIKEKRHRLPIREKYPLEGSIECNNEDSIEWDYLNTRKLKPAATH